jgi:ABC-type histidine transport system ATPase subunit
VASLAPRADFPHLADVVYLHSGSIGLMPLPVQDAAAPPAELFSSPKHVRTQQFLSKII